MSKHSHVMPHARERAAFPNLPSNATALTDNVHPGSGFQRFSCRVESNVTLLSWENKKEYSILKDRSCGYMQ